MIIGKYTKLKDNRYKVIIDDTLVTLYDDTILKFGLLVKKSIDIETFNEMMKFNDELGFYYLCVKYINKRLRSEREIRKYLEKYTSDISLVDSIVERLYENHLLNEEMFARSFILDAVNLGNDGREKIIKKLRDLGISDCIIFAKLNDIDDDIWENKARKYIDKKIRFNHNSSKYQLISKITMDLVNLGYSKEMVSSLISEYDIEDDDIQEKEYQKAKRTLEKKYSGKELERKIREKLYRKGFRNVNVDLGSDYYEE